MEKLQKGTDVMYLVKRERVKAGSQKMWVLVPGLKLCHLRQVIDPLGLLAPHLQNESVGPDKLKSLFWF